MRSQVHINQIQSIHYSLICWTELCNTPANFAFIFYHSWLGLLEQNWYLFLAWISAQWKQFLWFVKCSFFP